MMNTMRAPGSHRVRLRGHEISMAVKMPAQVLVVPSFGQVNCVISTSGLICIA